MKPLCIVTIATDKDQKYLDKLKESVTTFHPDIPLVVIGDKEIKESGDTEFIKRATPSVVNLLLKEYERVIRLPVKSEIIANLSPLLQGDFDIYTSHEKTQEEAQKSPYSIWFIAPIEYLRSDFLIAKNNSLVAHWQKMCYQPYFKNYPRGETDMLNILLHYSNHAEIKIRLFPKLELLKYIKIHE